MPMNAEQRELLERLSQLNGEIVESIEMEADGAICILFAKRRGELWIDGKAAHRIRVNLP